MTKRFRLRPFLFALPLLAAGGLSHAAGDAGSCHYVPFGKLPLQSSGNLPLPVIAGSVNGQPATLLLATGAYTTQLTRTVTDRLAIPIRKTGRYTLGVGGASDVYTATLRDFSIGPFHTGKIVLSVIGNSATPAPFDAVVGADTLLRTDMEIDLAGKFVQFFRGTGCGDTFLAYWDKDAMEIPFGGTQVARDKPRFIVELNGKRLEATIGTGSPRTSVSREAAERLGIKPGSGQAPQAGYATGVGDARVARWQATFDTLTIGSETIKNAQLSIIDTPPQGNLGDPDIVLGDDFLRAHRVLIAMSQQRLYVSYNGGEVFEHTR